MLATDQMFVLLKFFVSSNHVIVKVNVIWIYSWIFFSLELSKIGFVSTYGYIALGLINEDGTLIRIII